AQWTDTDTKEFLGYLYTVHSEMGEGYSFKGKTFSAAADFMKGVTTVGGDKDKEACRVKWQTCKEKYNIIGKIKEQSGWGPWSDEHGAGITGLTAEAWDKFVGRNKTAKPFRNKGWIFLHDVEKIMPYKPKGTNV
ncbi:hypothetical protein BDP27DRAFT_1191184, partial [Rhodocollybia butyracea]